LNPFVSRINNQSWVVPISGMCLVLGFMVSLAWVTKENRNSRSVFLRADQRARVSDAVVDLEAFEQTTNEVKKLQEEKTRLENALSRNGEEGKVLNESLQEVKSFAGLTPIEGPGIVVTLSDSAKSETGFGGQTATNPDSIVHDRDVLHTVNELFASGAEAVAVNDLRVSPVSSFRCVGTTILVNDVKIASPIHVRAIGDPDALFGAMNMPGGSLSEVRMFDPAMVQIEKVRMQLLPAYTGTTQRRFAKVPKKDTKDVAPDSKTPKDAKDPKGADRS